MKKKDKLAFIRVPRALKEAIRKAADAEDISMGEWMRRVLNDAARSAKS